MIYNFNLGIGWASSGVEYAQSYRANIFRQLGVDAKFVFTDMFSRDNIEHMTKNLGFLDSEIIWLYTFFTDTKISKVTYTLDDLLDGLEGREYTLTQSKGNVKIVFPGDGNFYTVYFVEGSENLVHRVELVSKGCLIRKDYYTYCKIYSEYYAPLEKKAHLYSRRFFNENGSVAYEEIIDDGNVMYKFSDRVLYSVNELVGYMVSRLKLKESDTILLDRTTGIGQAVLMNAGKARVGAVIHAEHFSEAQTDEANILWNNHYEYSFSQADRISFYICATEDQSKLVKGQFKKYKGKEPTVVTIPVGCLEELAYGNRPRRRLSLVTASRLAKEKNVDMIIEAVSKAKKIVPGITLDIYGKGPEEKRLKEMIEELSLTDSVRLCGQQRLKDKYVLYEAYVSASLSEGFGLTLMEAVGSGLPIIGFDARYGNQSFIDDRVNGYKIPIHENMDRREKVAKLTDAIVKLFTEADIEAFRDHSYKKAENYLAKEVEKAWAKLLEVKK